MNDNEQRDELARDIFVADNHQDPNVANEWEAFKDIGGVCGADYAHNIADRLYAAGYRKPNMATALREIANSREAMERARRRIEDELVDWRDGGLSTLRRNGLAIYDYDGTPNGTIRFGFEEAFRIALNAEADRMEAETTR